METAANIKLSQSMIGFHRQCFVSQSLEAKIFCFLQNTLINREALFCLCWQGHGMSQGIVWLCRICLEWLRPGHQLNLEALRRMSRELCVLHRIWFASARCGCLLRSATRSRLVRQLHVPYGTPKWVKTRLAASLRQGLTVILSAKSSHA